MSDAGTTPRPWTYRLMNIASGDEKHWVVVRADEDTAPGKTYVTFMNERSIGSEADAALIVEAVNSYDRLRAIEAAARAWSKADRAAAFSLSEFSQPTKVISDLDEAQS